MATYIHFIITGFSKTAKRSRHTSTGFLVDYAGGSGLGLAENSKFMDLLSDTIFLMYFYTINNIYISCLVI